MMILRQRAKRSTVCANLSAAIRPSAAARIPRRAMRIWKPSASWILTIRFRRCLQRSISPHSRQAANLSARSAAMCTIPPSMTASRLPICLTTGNVRAVSRARKSSTAHETADRNTVLKKRHHSTRNDAFLLYGVSSRPSDCFHARMRSTDASICSSSITPLRTASAIAAEAPS